MIEEWKPIKGYEGLYEVSNLGRVKRCERYRNTNDTYLLKEQILTLDTHKTGYLYATLYNNTGSNKKFQVQRLVAEAFIPNPENKPEVDHINTIVTDNSVSNLRWVTHKENLNNELTIEHFRESAHKCKVAQLTLDGKVVKIYNSMQEAARDGFSAGNISAVCRGDRKQHKGYLWLKVEE